MEQFLEKWAAYFIAAGTALGAFVWAVKRDSLRIEQIATKVEDIENRVRAIEKQGTAEAVTFGRIEVQLQGVLAALADLKAELKGKVDK